MKESSTEMTLSSILGMNRLPVPVFRKLWAYVSLSECLQQCAFCSLEWSAAIIYIYAMHPPRRKVHLRACMRVFGAAGVYDLNSFLARIAALLPFIPATQVFRNFVIIVLCSHIICSLRQLHPFLHSHFTLLPFRCRGFFAACSIAMALVSISMHKSMNAVLRTCWDDARNVFNQHKNNNNKIVL